MVNVKTATHAGIGGEGDENMFSRGSNLLSTTSWKKTWNINTFITQNPHLKVTVRRSGQLFFAWSCLVLDYIVELLCFVNTSRATVPRDPLSKGTLHHSCGCGVGNRGQQLMLATFIRTTRYSDSTWAVANITNNNSYLLNHGDLQ